MIQTGMYMVKNVHCICTCTCTVQVWEKFAVPFCCRFFFYFVFFPSFLSIFRAQNHERTCV